MIDKDNCSRDELLAELVNYRRFSVKTLDGSSIQVTLAHLRNWVKDASHASRRYKFQPYYYPGVGHCVEVTTAN